jgi:hypothetical protein
MTFVYGNEDGISYPLTPAALIYGRNIATTPNARQFKVISTNKFFIRTTEVPQTAFTSVYRSMKK